MQRDAGSYSALSIYARRYFPGREIDEDCLAEAAFLEWDFWEKMRKMLGS